MDFEPIGESTMYGLGPTYLTEPALIALLN